MAITSGISTDVSDIFNKQAETRKVSADFAGGSVNSTVDKTGNTKVFEAASKQLGKQDFLQLLVTQLKYQDPMAPTENQEFVAQLAQFGSLEGTQNINTSIEALSKKIEEMVAGSIGSSTAISNASATNLMGKYVRVSASDIIYTAGQKKPVEISVHTDAGADSVLSVVDADGEIINVLPLKAGADTKINWDGTRMDGTKAPTGNYSIKVTSRDGVSSTGYAYFEDKVAGIAYSKTGMRLEVKGQNIAMDKVMHVGEAPAVTAAQ
jgi:flagellar basal-body rod modification protein FlgD